MMFRMDDVELCADRGLIFTSAGPLRMPGTRIRRFRAPRNEAFRDQSAMASQRLFDIAEIERRHHGNQASRRHTVQSCWGVGKMKAEGAFAQKEKCGQIRRFGLRRSKQAASARAMATPMAAGARLAESGTWRPHGIDRPSCRRRQKASVAGCAR
jgi:hypothetical protein